MLNFTSAKIKDQMSHLQWPGKWPVVAFLAFLCAVVVVCEAFSWELAKDLAYLAGGAVVIWLANRRAVALERTVNIAEKGLSISRFKDAVQMLGSKSAPVQLGAVYALHRMAQESGDVVKDVFHVLCEFVRHSPLQDKLARQAALNALFGKSGAETYGELQADLSGADLKFADLSGMNLTRVILAGAHLNGAKLNKANLSESVLVGVKLSSERISNANFSNADMSNSEFKYVHFENSQFEGAKFDSADLECAFFKEASGLSYEQLKVAKSLRATQGLPPDLEERLRRDRPELFGESPR